jgi:hypothetical protein
VFHSGAWLRLRESYGYSPVALTTSPASEAHAARWCLPRRKLADRAALVSLPFDHAEPLLAHPSELLRCLRQR